MNSNRQGIDFGCWILAGIITWAAIIALATALSAQDFPQYKGKKSIIHTDVDKKEVKAKILPLIDALDAFYAKEMAKEFGLKKKGSARHHVWIYTTKTYEKYTTKNPGLNPGFIQGPGMVNPGLHMWYSPDFDDFCETVFHEFTHLYIEHSVGGRTSIPQWIDEGIAVWFEMCTWDPKKKKVTYNENLHRIKHASHVSDGFSHFMVKGFDKWDNFKYGEAYLFIRYLKADKKRTAALKYALKKSGGYDRFVKNLEKKLKVPLKKHEDAWKKFSLDLQKPKEEK